MSASPLPTSVSDAPAPPPPGPPANRWRVLGSWIVILASVGLIAGLNAGKYKQPVVDSLNSSAPPNVRFELTARYSIGAKRLLEQATGKKDSSNDPLYLSQIDRYVTTTTDKGARGVGAGGAGRAGVGAGAARSTTTEGERHAAGRGCFSAADGVSNGRGRGARAGAALLIQRHGWFGKLALSWNQPSSSKEAEEVNAAAARAFYSVAGLGVLGLGGLILGSVLFIVALVRFIDGKVKLAYRPAAEPGSAFLESFAIYVGGMALLSLLLMIIPAQTGSRVSWGRLALSLLPVSVAMVWPLFRGVRAPEWRRGLGWTTGRGLFREMTAGILGYLAGMPVLAAGAAVTIFLTSVSGADPSHPIMNEGAAAWPRLSDFTWWRRYSLRWSKRLFFAAHCFITCAPGTGGGCRHWS